MRKSYKFRLYPNERQKGVFTSILYSCKNLYNVALEQRRDAWRLHRKNVSYYSQINQLPELKEELPKYREIYSQVLQDVLQRLDKTFQAFFRRIKSKAKAGYPRFKSIDRYNSFTYPQAYNHCLKFKRNRVFFSKIGWIKAKIHHIIKGKIKQATIKREDDKWFVILSCDSVPANILPKSDAQIGIDLGLTSFATLSDSTKINNPRHLKRSETKLKQAQQELSAKKTWYKSSQESKTKSW